MINECIVDLHTHSTTSPDGGLSADDYQQLVAKNPQCFFAVTDHNEISFALGLQVVMGANIIVGEEIMTQEGEIIGLFLTKKVPPRLSARETAGLIKSQNGLVYVPHPLEKTRKGLQLATLKSLARSIDIIESYNARSREQWLGKKVKQLAEEMHIVTAASSDAHGIRGIGRAYSALDGIPTKENLVSLLQRGALVQGRARTLSLLDPLRNKIKRKLWF